ncbi:hypothetical protein DW189_13185 [Alistipes sp. AM16-43]|nr:hypothetical protein DW189_13185 [Alistipes sp. AM16-43]
MIWDKNLRQNILQKAVFFLQCEQRKITQIFLKQFTITGIKKTVSQNTLCCFALPLFFVRIY